MRVAIVDFDSALQIAALNNFSSRLVAQYFWRFVDSPILLYQLNASFDYIVRKNWNSVLLVQRMKYVQNWDDLSTLAESVNF